MMLDTKQNVIGLGRIASRNNRTLSHSLPHMIILLSRCAGGVFVVVLVVLNCAAVIVCCLSSVRVLTFVLSGLFSGELQMLRRL